MNNYSFPLSNGVSRKYLSPLFIYQILIKESNSAKPLSYQYLMEALSTHPYSISVSKRTVTEIVKVLAEFDPHIFYRKSKGVWYNAEHFNIVYENGYVCA